MVPTNHLPRKGHASQSETNIFPPAFQKPTPQNTPDTSWNLPHPPNPTPAVMTALTDSHPSSGSGASLSAQPLEAVALDSSYMSVACGEASVPVCCRGGSGRWEEGQGLSPKEQQQCVCSVCGNKADGNFFGATVCLPCKSFFIRCTKDGEPSIVKQCHGSCDVTKQLRNRCQFCRFQRCLDVGMTRKEKPEVVLAEEGQALCLVCGDLANGVHFGVTTCEGCKKFFRRGLKEHESYVCRSSKDCVLNPRNRNNCRYCRYQKCLAAGMSRDAIKMGRPRKILSKADSEGTELSSTTPSADVKAISTPTVDTDLKASPQDPHEAHSDRQHSFPRQSPFGQDMTSFSMGEPSDWTSSSDGLWKMTRAGRDNFADTASSVAYAAPRAATRAPSGSVAGPVFSAADGDGQLRSPEYSAGKTESPVIPRTDAALLSYPVTPFALAPSAMISEQPAPVSVADSTRAESDVSSSATSQPGQHSWASSSIPSLSHPALLTTAGRGGDEYHSTSSTAAPGVALPQRQTHPAPSQMGDMNPSRTFQSFPGSLPTSQPGQGWFVPHSAGLVSASPATTSNSAAMAGPRTSADLAFHAATSLEEASELSSAATCTGTCGRKDCPFYARNAVDFKPHMDLSQTSSAGQPSAPRFASPGQEQTGSAGVSHGLDLDRSVRPAVPVEATAGQRRFEQNHHHHPAEDMNRAVKIPRRDDGSMFGDHPFGLSKQAERPALTQNAHDGTVTATPPALSRSHTDPGEHMNETWQQPANPPTHSQPAQRAENQPWHHQPWTPDHSSSSLQGGDPPRKVTESSSRPDGGSSSSQQWTSQQGDPPGGAGQSRWRLRGVYDPYLDKDEMFRVNQVFVSVNTMMEAAEGEEDNPWNSTGSGAPSEMSMLEDLMQTQYRFSPKQTIHYWQNLISRCGHVPIGGQIPDKYQQILDSMLQAYIEVVETTDNSKYESVETGGSEWPQDDRVRTYWNAIQRRIVRGTQCCIKCAYQVPGVERIHPNDKNLLIRRDVIFPVGLLSASTVFFDPDKKDFKHFFNWNLGQDHPMAMFRQRLVGIGRKIFAQQMDLNEIALIYALNVVCLDTGEFTDPETIESVMLDLLMTLNCYISCLRKMSAKHRMHSLFALMPRMRMMGVWHGSLMKNMKFDTNLTKINIDNIQLDDTS